MQDMTDDEQMQQHVENALDWARPCVDSSRICVTVHSGIVTLQGDVRTSTEKATVERVTRLLYGVDVVVNEVAVIECGPDQGRAAGERPRPISGGRTKSRI
jgi:osmotically-inducible protein OsmY